MMTVTIVVLLALVTMGKGQIDCASQKVDLSLIIDESFSIGIDSFVAALQFLVDLISGANINPNMVQVSVITFDTRIFTDIHFDDFSNDKPGLLSAINILDYLARFGSETAGALTLASEQTFAANERGERPDARNVAIVVTDGGASNTDVELQAAIAKLQNVSEVFAVGIGAGISFMQLQDIASDPNTEHVYELETSGSLMTVRDALFTALFVDECTENTDNCDPAATCNDTPTSFECTCPPPMVGDGTVGNCNPRE
ncbi:cartilage matrix protein-like [Haliotis cracherodii]|uniref:cartilage matrix protein-like n=1 Tax=Haliotis cracherodii TaxID=6455 RepID=UPI0039EB7741